MVLSEPNVLVETTTTYRPLKDRCSGETLTEHMLWIQNRVFWLVSVAMEKERDSLMFLEGHLDEMKGLVSRYNAQCEKKPPQYKA